MLYLRGIGVAATDCDGPGPRRSGPPPLNPLVVESLAPLLAGWIASRRDAAKAQGVEAMPAPIRAALTGYVPEHMLDARALARKAAASCPCRKT